MRSLVLAFLLALTGCSTGQTPAPKPRIDPKPVVASQVEKDRVVVEQAKAAEAVAPEVKPHTDAIQQAVAAAPASQVEDLVKALQAQLAAVEKENAKLKSELADWSSKVRFWITLGGYGFAFLCVAGGVAAFVLAAQYAFLGPKLGFALAGAGASSFVLVTAYDWTQKHPWVTGLVLLLLLVAGVLAYANHWHASKKDEPAN